MIIGYLLVLCSSDELNHFFLQELFDYIALELAKFISEHEVTTDDTPDRQKALGFIVSYPVDQAAASSGAAIKWKSFSVTDTVECVFSIFLVLFFFPPWLGSLKN